MKLGPDSISAVSSDGDALALRSMVWTRHWASGAPHSCTGTYGECYEGAVADFWKTVFGPLTGGQRVLDIASGNGALPRLLLNLQPEAPIAVDAIDLAAIEPRWLAARPPATRNRVRFHGGVQAEHLPFPDKAFDLVVSQYGIEYSDLERSIAEMLRVLALGGRIALLLHAFDSRPVTLAAVELAHIEWLMSDAGLLPATTAMLGPISRAGTPLGRAELARDRDAEVARERFNGAQDALRLRTVVQDGADVLFEVQGAVAAVLEVAARHGAPAARGRLNDVLTAAQDSRLRLQQLCDRALTRPAFDALCQTLRHAVGRGGTVTPGEVWDHGHLMGRTVVAQAATTRDC